MFVLDSHCDTPTMMMRGLDLGAVGGCGHVDIDKLKRGGVDASFFALYTSAELSPDESTRYTLEMLGKIYDALDVYKDSIALATSPSEALRNKENGLISIFIGMENGSPIQKSLSLLRMYYRFGVRYMTLTHNGDNEIADAAAEGHRWHGLSPFGREVVEEMNRLGMIVDVAHVSDETFYDVIRCSKAPIVSTHSCCRALASHPRNMTDEMIRTMADRGGVIQINLYPAFLSDAYQERMPSVKDIAAHIDHAVKVGGIEHVGIGTDYDGIEITPEGMEDISKLPKIFDELTIRGYTEDEIEKIAGGNFIRVFNEVISCSLGQ